MHIRYGFRIDMLCDAPMPLLAMMDIHPSRRPDITMADPLVARQFTNPRETVQTVEFLDSFGNLCRWMMVPAGGIILRARGIVYHSGFAEEQCPEAEAVAPERLTPDLLPFLRASRFCETDKLASAAQQRFSAVEAGWSRVAAICDFVHQHLRYNARLATSTRSAFEVFEEETGASRDYAHLAITLCRCMDVPARYCTGYLPPIDIDKEHREDGFSAWFEAYLGDRWWTFDASEALPRIGHILIAHGRDASDVPSLTAFGPHRTVQFQVIAEEVDGARFPISSSRRREHSVRQSLFSGSGR
ncbi:MAG: transglutaminase family protein [Beijerinckiaceae bacterium]|nr:transglutaminase family protein [Beijerinckiaceae bacterium]MCZ8300372.1 transglutaminase family protein [Beijerinckiaceae bacterium]